jgi:hypothetical protein
MSEWIKPMTPLQVAQAEAERLQKCEDDYRRIAANRLTEIEALREKVAELEARLESEDSELDEELCMLLHSGSEPGVHGPREHIALARQARAEGRQLCTPAERRVLEASAYDPGGPLTCSPGSDIHLRWVIKHGDNWSRRVAVAELACREEERSHDRNEITAR